MLTATAEVQPTPITVAMVPQHRRTFFLPKCLGTVALVMEFQNMLFVWAERLCEQYTGGYWDFFELDNGGFFLALNTPNHLRLECQGNYSNEVVSAEAAGIVITLFTLSHLAHNHPRRARICEQYHALRDYALDHPEATKIFKLID